MKEIDKMVERVDINKIEENVDLTLDRKTIQAEMEDQKDKQDLEIKPILLISYTNKRISYTESFETIYFALSEEERNVVVQKELDELHTVLLSYYRKEEISNLFSKMVSILSNELSESSILPSFSLYHM